MGKAKQSGHNNPSASTQVSHLRKIAQAIRDHAFILADRGSSTKEFLVLGHLIYLAMSWGAFRCTEYAKFWMEASRHLDDEGELVKDAITWITPGSGGLDLSPCDWWKICVPLGNLIDAEADRLESTVSEDDGIVSNELCQVNQLRALRAIAERLRFTAEAMAEDVGPPDGWPIMGGLIYEALQWGAFDRPEHAMFRVVVKRAQSNCDVIADAIAHLLTGFGKYELDPSDWWKTCGPLADLIDAEADRLESSTVSGKDQDESPAVDPAPAVEGEQIPETEKAGEAKWWHDPSEKRPADYKFGPIQGTEAFLGQCFGEKPTPTPRRLKTKAKSIVYVVKHGKGEWEMWFKVESTYATANQRGIELQGKAKKPTRSTKRKPTG